MKGLSRDPSCTKGVFMDELAKRNDSSPAVISDDFAVETFRAAIERRQEKVHDVIEKVAKIAIDTANLAANAEPYLGKPGVRYVVDTSKAIGEALQNGYIKFDTNEAGEMFAQIRRSNGEFGKRIPIKEELIERGINPTDAVNAIQLQAIRQQLAEVTEALSSISEDIAEVKQGQYNDRLGLYESGLTLYLEAQTIQNEQLKQFVSTQELKSLSDASEQMKLAMQSDSSYLLEGNYKSKKKVRAEEIKSRIASINKCFEAIHASYVLKAAVYFDLGETDAMLATFGEYGRFLESSVIPNAPRLREFDSSDKLLKDGVWESRAKSIAGIKEMRSQLAGTTTYYLEPNEIAEEEDEDDEGQED